LRRAAALVDGPSETLRCRAQENGDAI
jgi:hypothetical protein